MSSLLSYETGANNNNTSSRMTTLMPDDMGDVIQKRQLQKAKPVESASKQIKAEMRLR